MKKQEPFHYCVKLPEVEAELAAEFIPEDHMTNIYFVKDGKQHILTLFPNKSIVCEIDLKTDKLKFFDVVYNDKIGLCEVSRKKVN